MGLASPGIGTGLDINGIVSAMVEASYAPKQVQLDKQEEQIEAEISAIGKVESGLDAFLDKLKALQDTESLNKRSATSSNESALAVTASGAAAKGSYQVDIQQLAQAQKVATAPVADRDAPIGQGSITLYSKVDEFGVADPNSAFTVNVGATDSLEDLVESINLADDNSGISATIIEGDNGPQLVLSSDESGLTNQISVSTTDLPATGTGVSDLFASMQQLQAPQDAILTVDGLTVTSASNSIEGVIDGVTLDLKQAQPGSSITVAIELDVEGTKEVITGFVEEYNKLQATLTEVSKFDASGENNGALYGDSLIRNISTTLRRAVGDTYEAQGMQRTLGSFGISVDRYGTLQVNDSELTKALETDMTALSQIFSKDGTGLANSLSEKLKPFSQTGGIIDQRDDSLVMQRDRVEDQREVLKRQMEMYEARLFAQFNAMDSAVYELNSQAAEMQSRLASM